MAPLRTLRSVVRLRPIELDPVTRRLRRAANVDDLRRIARRRLPHGVFDYIDGAAEDEISLARNVGASQRVELRPRVLCDVSSIDPSVSVLGQTIPLPLIFAPTGFTRIACSEGELAVARAAARAGLPYTLSTLSTRSIEEVAVASAGLGGDRWFQVYVWRDRGLVRSMLDRAAAAGYSAIMLTVDTAVLGRRERDVRRGFTLPPKIGLDTLVDGAIHPAWTWDFVRAEPITFANVAGSGAGPSDAVNLSAYINSQFDQALSWADIAWFREAWDGPIILKGVQTVADALLAADAGVDAIALSNHGGRQLDTAPVPLELVAPVVDAVQGRVEVYCDGGVRRGSDVVKAVALGATACMIGRAYLFGLGAAGERGVDHVVGMFDEGIRRTMALVGCRKATDLSSDLVAWRQAYP
jgi:L-lactate dehydrogenase (cytochrome)